jgi:rhodanese-related sulfurtransferase/CBS domain-containing protein
MPRTIDRREVLRLRTAGAQVIEVLPKDEYDWAHLAGALHLPLKALDRQAARRLDAGRPVVVYCHDLQCDMSPRAAWWLEQLGLPDVADYAAGKMDWLAHDHPYQGTAVLAGKATQRQTPTCTPDEPLADVRRRLASGGPDTCVVVNAHGVVMGVLAIDQTSQPPGDSRRLAADVMKVGVSTVRPSEELEPLVERMEKRHIDTVVVTRADGTLIGTLHRKTADALLARQAGAAAEAPEPQASGTGSRRRR